MSKAEYSRRKFLRQSTLTGFGIALMGATGCNYLDVVPKDTPDINSAFSNRSVAKKFLSTCYSHLPDPTDPFFYPAYFTSRDEFDCRTRSEASVAGFISRGLQNTNNPLQNYWSGTNGGKSMYQGIRDCNIFLKNIHIPQDMEESERERWIAEVEFLKAYYHFFLMKLYGPIVIVDKNIPISAPTEKTKPYREPVDTCVEYIVKLLDQAISVLPLTLLDPQTEQARITKTIALAIKAKVLALAASPLFNGNMDYAGWVDNRGKELISSKYDPTKWERAAKAIKEAIDASHIVGKRLYEFNKLTSPSTFNMNDDLVQEMTIRKAITEDFDKNPGVIWATQRQFADGKGGAVANLEWNVLGNMLKQLYPMIYPEDHNSYVNNYSASWHMGELFYSNNGVPIDEDKHFDYAGRFRPRRATPGDNIGSYIATGEITANLHFNREPRFYADLGFDRGFFELASTTNDGGETFEYLRHRPGELAALSFAWGLASYVPKKIIAFETSCSQGDINKRYTPHNYSFPLIRLADLYLLYSEALNEVKTQPDAEVYEWVDKVRKGAGLKGVVESWEQASLFPNAPKNKQQMRQIIQKERLIELAFEGQRFWDLRRWKMADKYWSLPPTRWGDSKDPNLYYVPTQYAASRQVTFRDYLYPIRNIDLRINENLVQTYGWE